MKLQKRNINNKNSGFTLVELLLGVTIAVMISLTASSILALLFRSDIKTKRVEAMEQTKNDLQVDFSNAIRWAEIISFTSGNNTTLSVDQTTYKLQDEKILKNDQPLTPSSVAVKKFSITDFSNSSDLKSLELIIELESKNNALVKDNVRIVVSQRKTLFEEQ